MGIEAGKWTFPLHIAASVPAQWLQEVLQSERSLVWLQVTSRNCTQFNPDEVEATALIVATCLEAGMESHQLAVVTPFRRKVMQIRHVLTQKIGENIEIPIVDTVERVQGLTVEALVVSLCASDPDYISSIAEFLFSDNRLNVAGSRARTKAIIISSPDIFASLPKTYSGLRSRNMNMTFFLQKNTHPIIMNL